jgi:hypothetical protein
MDQNLNANRVHNTELGFNTTRMVFIFGNLATLAMITFGDLSSDPFRLALSAFVIIINIASVLSFDTELKQFEAIGKDTNDENSNYAKAGSKNPWGAFRVFCLIICVTAAVTQFMAINA